jgi:DNA-binding MarR family transcriptional regulator
MLMLEADPELVAEAEALDGLLLTYLAREQRRLGGQLAQCSLTPAQYLALRHVADRSAGCPMGELSAALQQASATATGIVDRLVRRGLVRRQRDPMDRRLVLVHVTELGTVVLAEALALRRQERVAALAILPAEERRRLLRLFTTYLLPEG